MKGCRGTLEWTDIPPTESGNTPYQILLWKPGYDGWANWPE